MGSHCQSRQQHLTIQYSDKMFIEDEADAVFNEIRNQRKDSDDKEEEITTNDPVTPAVRETKAASPGPAPMITIKVDVLSDSIELEEPVSPPACHPSEGPPLLFSSQSIEDLAAVIVKENRGEKEEEEEEDIPKSGATKSVVAAAPSSKAVPALIPLTVSEFGGELPASSPSTLHMSGGGVYTTDSYYRNFGPRLTTSTTSSVARVSTPPPPPPLQPSVIKKLPVSTAAPMPAKKRIVIKSKPALAEDKEKQENILREFYKKSNLISEAQKTIKLSDGLEITPIINVPTVGPTGPSVPTKKRCYESTDNDNNQGSKRAKNDLVIEKIPRKNT